MDAKSRFDLRPGADLAPRGGLRAIVPEFRQVKK
jgi:hypothetical protein